MCLFAICQKKNVRSFIEAFGSQKKLDIFVGNHNDMKKHSQEKWFILSITPPV